jgi:hypothetical protein
MLPWKYSLMGAGASGRSQDMLDIATVCVFETKGVRIATDCAQGCRTL